MSRERECVCNLVHSVDDLTEEDVNLVSQAIRALTWSRLTFEHARDKIREITLFTDKVVKEDEHAT